ncbi:ATP-dependent RNA helicase DBP8 [Hondaea fermentalgiana]|uniref:ATP-dependent RNA helicase DBP8 n=1 Tax=Hondaea fermentalgiana TaxID=2315210 RepID=A0A2R5GHM2_9STRA|nr:ATP-dependent RNA helicase DBP8 [Hondaea fermentalgiana]|eukprot:GBG30397.1 ATP-dependent RNA helicase DBP8 [Hondaea fermentalgiana]
MAKRQRVASEDGAAAKTTAKKKLQKLRKDEVADDGEDEEPVRNKKQQRNRKNVEKEEATSDSEEEQDQEDGEEQDQGEKETKVTFEELKVHEEIVKACKALGWSHATEIQREAIPHALEGRDVIGLAETGSGKTGAFSVPMLCRLLDQPTRRLFGIVLAPTRELAFQIHEVVQGLGTSIGVKSCCVVGGVDRVAQAIALAKKPHIVIGTPGRVVDHLENTKGFTLDSARVLVLDEADRMLSMDFEEEINSILQAMPPRGTRQTFLFSATMTSKVAKLQRASLDSPVKVEVSKSRYQTVKTLEQNYMLTPAQYKDTYLIFILNELAGQTAIIFVSTCHNATRLALMMRNLGIGATALHGQMHQTKRLGALNRFKSQGNNVLVATDVAARGLDIPSVDLVVNYDVPSNGKDYIHRVGRTARAGKAGRAVTLVTQYDVEVFQRIEAMLRKKLTAFPAQKDLVMVLNDQVSEAARQAVMQIREEEEGKGGKRRFHGKGRGGGGGGGGGGRGRGRGRGRSGR